MPFQNTKIIATVGPASESYLVLKELIVKGVDLFRLNFSHGTHEQHAQVIKHIIQINEELGTHAGIMADLQGPKLRIGQIKDNSLVLKAGDIVTFKDEECLGTMEQVYMSYDHFARDVKPGEKFWSTMENWFSKLLKPI